MASKNQTHNSILDSTNDLSATISSTKSDKTVSDDNGLDSVSSLSGLILSSAFDYISPHQQNNIMDIQFDKICGKYKIQQKMAERLRKLQDYEIVIVCDDSGSMKETVDGTNRTRWDELRKIVKKMLRIAVIFDSNGVDIYFLNRQSYLKVKDPKQVDQAFAPLPSGYTPLVPVLTHIFESPLAQPGREKKLLVLIATDGEPTDEDGNPNVDELKTLMLEKRNADTTYVSFLVCTDKPETVRYLKKWDKIMKNVDVTDDFKTEKEKIRSYRGPKYPFSHGDYIVKAILGPIDPQLDLINEPDHPNDSGNSST